MTSNIPAFINNSEWHPGELIRDEMEALNYSKEELSERLGLSLMVVDSLLEHTTKINSAYAILLSKVLGKSSNYWINIENIWNQSSNKD